MYDPGRHAIRGVMRRGSTSRDGFTTAIIEPMVYHGTVKGGVVIPEPAAELREGDRVRIERIEPSAAAAA